MARAMASASTHVPRRHVVQRAVRLDVRETDALSGSNSGEGSDLIGDEILDLACRRLHLTAAETGEIGKPRMSSDRDAMFARQARPWRA